MIVFKMLLIILSIYDRKFMVIPQTGHYLSIDKVGKKVKFYVPTWTLFAGPVTYCNMAIYCNTLEGNMQYSDDPYCFTPKQ